MLRIFSSFVLLLFLAANVAIAEDSYEGDYIELEKGEVAPYTGFLFDHSGVVTLIAKNEKEKAQLILDKDTEYKKLKLNLESDLSKKQAEIDNNKELAEKILALNKEELKTTQIKLERISWLSPALFVAGVTVGSILTISILKVAVTLAK